MKEVFLFTFRNQAKGKGYKFSIFFIPVILFLIITSIILILAYIDSPDSEVSVEKIYLNNQAGLTYLNFDEFDSAKVIVGDKSVPENEKRSISVTVKKNGNEYSLYVSVPEWSEIDSDVSVDELSDYIIRLAKTNAAIIKDNGKHTEEEIFKVFKPAQVSRSTVVDDKIGIGSMLLEIFVPFIILFISYFMILIYGQTIAKNVISEKVSKLIETMLISVKPSDIIFGKVFALALNAILQTGLWIIGIVAGLLCGNTFAKIINPSYSNIIFDIIKLIKDSGDNIAFSVPAIIFAVLVLFIGFLFYCFFAGLIASPVGKAEELSQAFRIYSFATVIGFLVPYNLIINNYEGTVFNIVTRIVPFTSAFRLPSDILLGRIGILESMLYVGVLIIFCLLCALYTGKLYKNQIFYNNSSVNVIKRIFIPLKNK